MMKKILYALFIGAGVGLTGTFLYINFTIPIKILGITLSLCMLISGMVLSYRSNLKK